MKRVARWRRDLQAYHDGELSPWRRFWFERRLRKDPLVRQELEYLQTTSNWLKAYAKAEEPPVHDLWHGIQGRIALTPAPEATSSPSRAIQWYWGVGVSAATAALVLLLVTSQGLLYSTELESSPSVEWLDTGATTTMILQDDAEATIIWLVSEPQGAMNRRGQHGRV